MQYTTGTDQQKYCLSNESIKITVKRVGWRTRTGLNWFYMHLMYFFIPKSFFVFFLVFVVSFRFRHLTVLWSVSDNFNYCCITLPKLKLKYHYSAFQKPFCCKSNELWKCFQFSSHNSQKFANIMTYSPFSQMHLFYANYIRMQEVRS